ncbi:MAG: hypothetical protein ACP5LP_03205 [Candidatus Micrarchaeia archaeon]
MNFSNKKEETVDLTKIIDMVNKIPVNPNMANYIDNFIKPLDQNSKNLLKPYLAKSIYKLLDDYKLSDAVNAAKLLDFDNEALKQTIMEVIVEKAKSNFVYTVLIIEDFHLTQEDIKPIIPTLREGFRLALADLGSSIIRDGLDIGIPKEIVIEDIKKVIEDIKSKNLSYASILEYHLHELQNS